MKRLLILSYHSLPLNVIASYRTEAYLKHLPAHGYKLTLVTQNFKKSVNGVVHERHSSYQIYRLPWNYKEDERFGKFELLKSWILGHIDNKKVERAVYNHFKNFCIQHLGANPYDGILAVCSPFHHFRLASELSHRFNIPFAVDFRDLHDNRILSEETISLSSKLKNAITAHYFIRWAKRVSFLVAVSKPHVDYLSDLTRRPTFEILNGYEEELIGEVNVNNLAGKFQISSIGNLQNCQKLEVFYTGLKRFLADVDIDDIQINFIGLTDRFRKGIKQEVKNNVPNELLNVSDIIPKIQAIGYAKSASVLIFPTLVGFKGNYTGKFFEYLGVNRPILMFPRDEEFTRFEHLENVTAISDEKEIAAFLLMKYDEWKKRGGRIAQAKYQDRKEFSRSFQVAKLAQLIKEKFVA